MNILGWIGTSEKLGEYLNFVWFFSTALDQYRRLLHRGNFIKAFSPDCFYVGVEAPTQVGENRTSLWRDNDVPASWSAEDSSRSGWSFCPPPPETIGTMRKVRRTTRIRRFTIRKTMRWWWVHPYRDTLMIMVTIKVIVEIKMTKNRKLRVLQSAYKWMMVMVTLPIEMTKQPDRVVKPAYLQVPSAVSAQRQRLPWRPHLPPSLFQLPSSGGQNVLVTFRKYGF